MGTDSLVMHRFRDADDIKYLFQQELNKFPVVDGRLRFGEFGALLIRPKGEPKNRLTHIVFPETIIAVPGAGNSMRGHSSSTFTQTFLMVNAETNDLYIKVVSDKPTADNLSERTSLILPIDQVYANTNIWNLFDENDKSDLKEIGFDPEMSLPEWSSRINAYLGKIKPITYAMTDMGDFIDFREFPFSINQRGALGTDGSFTHMPRFIVDVITENQFVYDENERYGDEEEIPYEIGDAHIHPRWEELDEFQKVLAERISENIIRRTPSIADIACMRSSRALYKDLSKIFQGRETNTIESLEMIIETDANGQVNGLCVLDFGDADIQELGRLNDLALETVKSPTIDFGIIAEHYNFIDSLTKNDFGTPGNSEHVGDPDYHRIPNDT